MFGFKRNSIYTPEYFKNVIEAVFEKCVALEQQNAKLLERINKLEAESKIGFYKINLGVFFPDIEANYLPVKDAVQQLADHAGVKFEYNEGTKAGFVLKPKAEETPKTAKAK
jgi:hypothetical protein